MTATALTRHVLPGLQPEPLASYLAGLGLIRVLGEQADRDVTAAWTADGLTIGAAVEDIAQWLTDQYRPMPVLSPWNGGSGFGAKDKEPLRRLDAIRANPSPRLSDFRRAMATAEEVVLMARDKGWITESGIAAKDRVVLEFRNRCPDELLPWIDAAIVLADDDTFFPPLLGTGGNDGRLEFSTNFHQQLIELIGTSGKERARSLAAARDLLDGTQLAKLSDVPIGQFDPGNAGGPGSSRFGAAASLANPWSYLLAVEGAVLFAASATRKNQHAAGRAAMPFTVTASPDGSASGAAGEESRGEVWVPVWHNPLTLAEIRQLFAEARASWRGRPARRAVDFYAATRSLGVTRGIDEFVRYGMHRRNGLAFAAVPLDRIEVRERPAVQLSAAVEDWATRVRSDASTAIAEAHRAFGKSHLEFARDGEPRSLARMLAALTTLEMTVGRSGGAKGTVPVRYAPPADSFFPVLREISSPELRVAVGLASCATWPAEGLARSMRQILLPVDPADAGGKPRWRDAPIVAGLGARPLVDVLAHVLAWRLRTAATERNAARFRGAPTFTSGVPVPAADLHAFALGAQAGFDDAELDLYLRACLALNWRSVKPRWMAEKPHVPVTTLALLHPLAAGLRTGVSRNEPDEQPVPALMPEWSTRLASGQAAQVQRVHDQAAARLRQVGGWTSVPAPPHQAVPDGARIAAAVVARCMNAVAVLRMIALEPSAEQDADDADPNPRT
jgi:CRISPR-associated protein Csx17